MRITLTPGQRAALEDLAEQAARPDKASAWPKCHSASGHGVILKRDDFGCVMAQCCKCGQALEWPPAHLPATEVDGPGNGLKAAAHGQDSTQERK